MYILPGASSEIIFLEDGLSYIRALLAIGKPVSTSISGLAGDCRPLPMLI